MRLSTLKGRGSQQRRELACIRRRVRGRGTATDSGTTGEHPVGPEKVIAHYNCICTEPFYKHAKQNI
jgi:hypothetical protein